MKESIAEGFKTFIREADNTLQYFGESAEEAGQVTTYMATSKPARRLVFGLFGSVLTIENSVLTGLNMAREDYEKALVFALITGGVLVGSLLLNKGAKKVHGSTERLLEERGNFSTDHKLLINVHRRRPPFSR